MKEYRLPQALGNVSDDLLLEAAQITKKRTNRTMKILRAAAVAAAVAIVITALAFWPADENYVTGPGVLVVRAYAVNEGDTNEINSTVLEKGIELTEEYIWTKGVSHKSYGIPLSLYVDENLYPGMEITFEVRVSDGHFRHFYYTYEDMPKPSLGGNVENIIKPNYEFDKRTILGNSFRVNNDFKLHWVDSNVVDDAENQRIIYSSRTSHHAYADIIIWADDYIAGYAVIEYYDVEGACGIGRYYAARILKSESFPEVNGAYQSISREYVEQIFAEIHNG